jgi:hypothetical protein
MIALPERYWEDNAGHLELGVPWITPGAYSFLEFILAKTSPRGKGPYSLEIGAGGSTRYFKNRFNNHLALETDKEWAEKVEKTLGFEGTVHCLGRQDEIVDVIYSIPAEVFELISIDSVKGYNRDTFLKAILDSRLFTYRAIWVLDNYASADLWPETHDFTVNQMIDYMYPDNPALRRFVGIDFDDSHWHGKGTRIIFPKELLSA